MKKAVIVADYGRSTGIGHLMRCAALAQALSTEFDVCFVCEDDEYQWEVRALAKEAGSEIRPVSGRLDAIPRMEMDLLIVDSYYITQGLLERLRTHSCLKLVIDDNMIYNWYEADIILNQNMGAERLKYPAPSGTTMLLGPQYVMLREMFRKKGIMDLGLPVTDIAITMGGADLKNTTLKVLEFLTARTQYRYHVIVGNGFSARAQLEEYALGCKNIQLHFAPDMAAVFSLCQGAVSACGSTIYELAVMGIPTAGIVTADNQENLERELIAGGMIVAAGYHEDLSEKKFLNAFDDLVKNSDLRKRIQQRQLALVAREGTANIVRAIEQRLTAREGRNFVDC